MKTFSEIQDAIRTLSYGQRRDLILWIHGINDDELAVAEAAVPYGAEFPARMSVEEYLASEAQSDIRHEYVDGEIFAMSGASLRHNAIALNLATTLRAHLQGTPCRAFIEAVKVRIRTQHSTFVYYPDVSVVCGPKEMDQHEVDDPKLVVEVLSPSTERIDRFEKAQNYRSIPTVEEYLLVAQHKPEITLLRRSDEWRPRVVAGPDTSIHLRSIDLALSLSQIYEDVLSAGE